MCNAHHMLRLAAEGTEVGLRNAEVRMDGGVGAGVEDLYYPLPRRNRRLGS